MKCDISRDEEAWGSGGGEAGPNRSEHTSMHVLLELKSDREVESLLLPPCAGVWIVMFS